MSLELIARKPPGLDLAIALVCGLAPLGALAQHAHLNAGAASATTGSPLLFANGATFHSASGYALFLEPVSSATYGPIFRGGADLTFTALPATLDNGGPSAAAALPGTRIRVVVESLEGPPGGTLSFWDSFDGFFEATEITFTVPVGTTQGTETFYLSENDGSPGADPYGHIHGRRWSASLPGLYTAGLRLLDVTQNGLNGGPIHAPSDLFRLQFQAGLGFSRVRREEGRLVLDFATQAGRNYTIEASDQCGPDARWTALQGPFPGTGRILSADPIEPAAARRFFRLRRD